MTHLKSPIQWLGGKQPMVNKLLPLFPEHKTYVEVFGGGGALMFAKQPSPVDVYNDLDSDLVNFFRVMRDPNLFPDFYNRAWLSPYSREEYGFCKTQLNEDPDPVERARRFFVLARYSFGGMIGSFGLSVTATSKGIAQPASAYRNVLCILPLISERLATIEVECRDFRKILDIYDTPNTFFYLDPPYLPSTRKAGKYKCELTDQDHMELVELLKSLKGKAMISGYPNELYDKMGWNRKEWDICCRAAGRTRASGLQGVGNVKKTQQRRECVWLNYEP